MANKAREKECLHSIFRANEPKEPSRNMKKLVAFTLAEVLITLAIVGVVAALTIPTLVTSYQKKMYVTQLKKSYNNITNGFQTAMANDGVLKLSDTTLWSKIPVTSCGDGQVYPEYINDNDYGAFFDEFKKSFKVAVVYGEGEKIEKYKIDHKGLNGEDLAFDDGGMFLADGSWLSFWFPRNPEFVKCNGSNDCTSLSEFQQKRNTKTKLWENIGQVIIDINGRKKPNIFGRDAFAFVLGNDGMLYPYGGADFAIGFKYSECNDLENCEYYWKNGENGEGACNLNSNGEGCAGRIIEEGWQMNY